MTPAPGTGSGYGDLAAYYSLLFPLNERQREFFAHLCSTGPAASVLDVGCGTGEHLAWFSARGVRAFGLEPDETMFQELRRRSWPGTVPTLVQAGVEALPQAVGEQADLVLCLGNTLPHLPSRETIRESVRRMAGALSQAGRIVLQTVNFDKVLAEGRSIFPVIERALPGGGRVSFHREYDLGGLPDTILFTTRLATPAGERSAAWPLVPLRRDELAGFARDAGLDEIVVFGDYGRVPFAADSPALILVAQRGKGR